MSGISRRRLLAGIALAPFVPACTRKGTPAPAPHSAPRAAAVAPAASVVPRAPVVPGAPVVTDAGPSRGATKIVTWSLPERGPSGEVAVIVPDDAGEAPNARWPLVIALHGRGEALKAPRDGALGWPSDYALVRAIARVNAPPLTAEDLEGFVDPERLAGQNAQLAARPYGGLVVVCPYLPDINLHSAGDLADYGRYLVASVLARARRELPVLAGPESTGIDGVSLGGATALRVGLAHTEAFGAVGALQPAIADFEMTEWVELARAARARRPSLRLRLTTSLDDVYEGPIGRLSQALRGAGVEHDFADVPGPHDYPWNRGPGSIELLLWHDRVLSRG